MIENIRLKPHKGLKGCDLLALGRINVVCGKNNSGKSTLLEVISRPDLSFVGRVLTREDSATLVAQTSEFMGWGNTPNFESSVYQKAAGLFAEQGSTRVWFSDDASAFSTELGALFQRLAGGRVGFDHPRVADWAKEYCNERPSSALVGAKRTLNPIAGYNYAEERRPDGSGVVNYLFRLKNADAGSPEKAHFDRIQAAFSKISGGYSLNISTRPTDGLLNLSYCPSGDTWFPADSCGLGLSDLVVLLVLALDPQYETVLIEEPESHLHPDMQRKLLIYLSEETDKQYFFSTHSNVFVTNGLVDQVLLTHFEGEVQVGEVTSRARALHDLGYSVADNLTADVIILVEGPSDVPVIEAFLTKMGTLSDFNIRLWPLGGDIMDKHDLTVFGGMKPLALVDRDPKSARVRNRFIQKCTALGIPVCQLERYSIENYFSLEALREVYHGQIDDTIMEIGPKKRLSDQLGFDVKKRSGEIARRMSITDIAGTDLHAFLESVRAAAEEGRAPLEQ